ncbi:MAG: DNA cytosine methyltransferase [Minisyncoccia bacterium]
MAYQPLPTVSSNGHPDRPRLLDLFCCAGGAGMGYARAGFDVTGVDIVNRPRYPFTFVQADVMTLDPDWIAGFDAIHASPPCQGYTALRHAPGAKGAPLLIDAVRGLLTASGRPWIIENVEEARWAMRDPLTLCGTMFGLEAEGHELRRHRLFEASFALTAPSPCQHSDRPVIGVYGGHARRRSSKHGGRGTRDVWASGHRGAASAAMGMDWATLAEMSEAIPPAYTEYLGRQLLVHMRQAVAA